MIVMKFGGSSIRDAERILEVTSIIQANLDKQPILVFSALGKTTDNLIKAGKQALDGEVSLEEIKTLHFSITHNANVAPF